MTAAHHTLAVLDAIRRAERDGVVSSNRVRPLIPEWVPSRAVGQVYSQLRRSGVLVETGHERSTDDKGRNSGKLIPVYRLCGPLAILRVPVAPPPKAPAPSRLGPAYGPCAACHGWTIRYGEHGQPLCQPCEAAR